MTITVESIMSYPVVTTSPEESLDRAASKMEQFGVGGLPVLEEGKLVGILSSRDVRRSHPNRLVADAMSANLVTVQKHVSLWEAFRVLRERQLERLPVLDGDRLVGIVTKSDLLIEMGKYTDELTGLRTRGFIRSVGEALINEGQEVIVLFFDLNNFGEFNKRYGHVEGDKCLKVLSRVLSDLIDAKTDYLCRYGGDEFAVLTTRTMEEAISWVQVAIRAIEEQFKEYDLQIEASVGLARSCLQSRGDGHAAALLDDLINIASLASTRAKREGRSLLVAG